MLDTGDSLSDFTLEGVNEDGEIETYSLTGLTNGGVAVLNGYVYDYSPVCTDQICDIGELEGRAVHDDVSVVGISGSGSDAHQQFIEENEISYPGLCDTAEEVLENSASFTKRKMGFGGFPSGRCSS